MDDSFFGFDATIPDDDGGDGGPMVEEEYDALNDETFGSAINGDWEEAHESLVRLGGSGEKIRRRRPDGDGLEVGNLIEHGGNGDLNFRQQHAHLNSSAPISSSSSTTAAAAGPFNLSYNSHFRGLRNVGGSDDLELNLSTMKLDDVDMSSFGDNDTNASAGNRVNLDAAVWAEPLFRDNLRSAFKPQIKPLPEPNANVRVQQMQHPAVPKITTLEDIERNLIIQQAIQKQQQHQPQQQQQISDRKIFDDFNLANRHHSATPTIPQHLQQQQQQPPPQQQQPQLQQHKAPPGFLAGQQQLSPPRPNMGFQPLPGSGQMGPGPMPGPGPGLMPTPQTQQQQQLNGMPGNRVPPGFIYPPNMTANLPQHHPLLQQHFPLGVNQRPLPNPHHLPTALNNFAMHPSFNAMRASGMHPAAAAQAFMQQQQQQPRIPPQQMHPNNLLNQPPNSMYNMFNMRLVQEIQQNHPLLQHNAVVSRQQQQQNRAGSMLSDRQKLQQQQQLQLQLQQQQLINRRNDPSGGGGVVGLGANGNLPQNDYDEYANLMSTRDKHWLIGIQLSQLNTDTPYIDDYYYTVYRERKAEQNGQVRHSQAHKDNQLNHPLTQPRGHAQLILVQLGNKNGSRNGHGHGQHRERRNSENTGGNHSTGGGSNSGNGSGVGGNTNNIPNYIFSPLKFENSLGKLQYGSVTAPRKIIDADIMGSDAAGDGSTTSSGSTTSRTTNAANVKSNADTPLPPGTGTGCEVTPSSMRKSRHILLHIETLYRYLLKLEDLENPDVMATIVLKKKKEAERIAALEQLEMAHKTPEERAAEAANPQSMNPQLKNKFNYEIEPSAVLVNKLKAGLTFDKVLAMMNVRKGKILLRRIMPFISGQSVCWIVWSGIFCSLQNVVKKDREDIEGIVYALYAEFKKHIGDANFETLVTLSSAVTLNDKKLTGIFCSRFGILSLVALILRAEAIYVSGSDATFSEENKEKWREFLAQVASCLNRTIQNQTISAAIESDAIQPLMDHFARFKDLKLDALLALITEARHQID
ncbi:protein PAT1 homolog 1 [Drosophila tropicalis]|uniref:protein PAT1 homolog 1 n=1 Tax=Drosophila tropicalis TaxID=46794 RepID=UPI0035AC07F8